MRRLSRGVSLGAGDEPPGREVFNDEKVVLVMVGLPARGKSFISHKITNFLLWLGVRADIFNVGSLRRKLTAGKQNFDFFDANNASAKQQREELAASALRSALEWLESGGEVAIFDATNTTRDRRAIVLETCREFSPDVHVIFVESICNDAQVLESNFMQKVTNSPDYKEMALEDAMADLRMRIHKYESVYETIESDELSYIKLINMQSKVICNRIYGNMAHLLVPFLMSIHILDRPIYICRPAHFAKEPDSTSSRELGTLLEESASKSSLDDDGQIFSSRLKELLVRETRTGDTTAAKALKQLRVYSSTAPRAMRTIAPLGLDFRPVSALNIVDAGVFANMSVADIRDRMSSNWGDFSRDPMNYRLHGGESIGDLVRRLSSFVVEVERQRKPVLIVSHILNLQVLYGYLLGRNVSEGLEMSIPLHTVIKLTPTQYGYKEERFDLRSTTHSDSIAKVDVAN